MYSNVAGGILSADKLSQLSGFITTKAAEGTNEKSLN